MQLNYDGPVLHRCTLHERGTVISKFSPVYFHHGPRQAVFTVKYPEKTVEVDDWQREQWFTHDFLLQSVPFDCVGMRVDYNPHIGGGIVCITVCNGKAVYKLVERDKLRGIIRGELVQAEIDVPQLPAERDVWRPLGEERNRLA